MPGPWDTPTDADELAAYGRWRAAREVLAAMGREVREGVSLLWAIIVA